MIEQTTYFISKCDVTNKQKETHLQNAPND